jgi:tetratricopeptide (TPR) repeat protein
MVYDNFIEYGIGLNGKVNHLAFIIVLMIFPCDLFSNGLSGEYLLTDYWRIFNQKFSPENNPSIIMEQQYTQFRGAGALSFDGAARLWEAGMVVPAGLYQTLGCTVFGENGKSVHDAGDAFLFNPSSADNTSSEKNNNLFIMLTYAANPFSKLLIGMNINYAYQSNFRKSLQGIGADIGLSWRLLLHPLFGYHIIGASFNNVVSPKTSTVDKMSYSSKIRGTYSIRLFSNRFELGTQCDIIDFLADESIFEKTRKKEWNVSIQTGIWVTRFLALRGFIESDEAEKFKNAGCGCEVNLPSINSGRDLSFTYQYTFNGDSRIDGTHSIYYHIDLGLHREEIFARKMARWADLNASDLYNRAMKLYFSKNYWEAYFLYSRLLVEYPDFFKNDMATYFSGSCLEELDMRDAAKNTYLQCYKNYKKSSAAPWSHLGLMRIQYRQGELIDASMEFSQIDRENVTDSVKQHAYYLMGEIEIKNKNRLNAISYFSVVPENHPDYVYAKISTSALHASLDDEAAMVASLEDCINGKVLTSAQLEVYHRALLHLGYSFYEENSLAKAIVAFRMIPDTSYYYPDALLGQGWAARRARQWNDCIEAGQKLTDKANRIVSKCEGLLLQAYGWVMVKKYDVAQDLLEKGLKLLDEYNGIQLDSVETEKIVYQSKRLQYDFFSGQVIAIAKRGKAAKQADVDSLHKEQINHKQRIDKFLKSFDEAEKTAALERNLKNLKEDMLYMHAKVERVRTGIDANKNREKILGKQNEIDNEIEKLKNEMDQINKKKE